MEERKRAGLKEKEKVKALSHPEEGEKEPESTSSLSRQGVTHRLTARGSKFKKGPQSLFSQGIKNGTKN